MELKDLPFESQLSYRVLCDDIDKCDDLDYMRAKFKELLLEHLKNQEATKQLFKKEFKKR
jgi:hypothetical protein